MTTRQEIKRFVAPLLERHPDLVFVNGFVAIRPVHHILRMIFIDRTSDAKCCRPVWAVNNLFVKTDQMHLGGGADIDRDGRLWWIREDGIAEDFCDVVERKYLPTIRAIRLEDGINSFLKSEVSLLPQRRSARLVGLIILNRLDEAAELMRSMLESSQCVELNEQEPGLGDRILAQGAKLSAGDRAALARIFHEREAYTVKKLKLESVWEKTPLPLESGIEEN